MINPITTLVNPTTNMLVSTIWYPRITRLIITTFSLCVNDLILYLFICYTYIIITTSYSYCRECYTRCYTRSARRSARRIGNGNVSAHGTRQRQHTGDQTRHTAQTRSRRGTAHNTRSDAARWGNAVSTRTSQHQIITSTRHHIITNTRHCTTCRPVRQTPRAGPDRKGKSFFHKSKSDRGLGQTKVIPFGLCLV